MPEIIFTGPAGRLEGRYHQHDDRTAPIALVLHPHPQYGGTMNNKVVYNIYRYENLHRDLLAKPCCTKRTKH